MKIVYIGIDLFFPALRALADNGCKIHKIFTCATDNITEFNTEIVSFAKENKIPYTLNKITREDIITLIEEGIECIICGGYYYRIPIVENIPMLNIHPTLLPIGRGMWPMPIIIMEGYEKSGVTIHKMEEEFDTGEILLQREFNIADDETHKTYMDKVCNLLEDMIEELVNNFDSLYNNALPQGTGEYFKAPDERVYTLSGDMTVKEADLILRAFYGYECFYEDNGKKICFVYGKAVKEKKQGYKYYKLKDGYIEAIKTI